MATQNRGDWTTLTQDVSLPTDFAAAVMTARPELARIIRRPLSAEETTTVAHAFATLIETNHQLQDRCSRLSVRLGQIRDNMNGIERALDRTVDYLESGDEDLLSSRAARRGGRRDDGEED